MKWLCLGAALLASVCAYSDNSYEETQPSSERPSIEILNRKGSLRIIGWDRHEIHVEGTLGSKVRRVDFDSDGDDAEITIDAPKSGSGGSADLTIHVPHGASLEIQTISASIDIQDVAGDDLEIETVSGNIKVDGASGDIDIEGVSGSIGLRDLDAEDVTIYNVSGTIKIDGVLESLEAETVSGGIDTGIDAESITAETVSGSLTIGADGVEDAELGTISGSIRFRGTLTEDGELDVHSISGSINVHFTEPAYGDYELSSFSGSFNCNLEPLSRLHSDRREMEFEFGDGKCDIRLESFSGSIRVE